jgi:hypothetical protein
MLRPARDDISEFIKKEYEAQNILNNILSGNKNFSPVMHLRDQILLDDGSYPDRTKIPQCSVDFIKTIKDGIFRQLNPNGVPLEFVFRDNVIKTTTKRFLYTESLNGDLYFTYKNLPSFIEIKFLDDTQPHYDSGRLVAHKGEFLFDCKYLDYNDVNKLFNLFRSKGYSVSRQRYFLIFFRSDLNNPVLVHWFSLQDYASKCIGKAVRLNEVWSTVEQKKVLREIPWCAIPIKSDLIKNMRARVPFNLSDITKEFDRNMH